MKGMNKRGGIIGTGISFFAAFLIIAVFMVAFFVISSVISLSFDKNEVKGTRGDDYIKELYPAKNADKGSLIERFLNEQIKINGRLTTVYEAGGKICDEQITAEQIRLPLRELFEAFFSNGGKNSFALVLESDLHANYLYSWYGGFGKDLTNYDISNEEFNKVYYGNGVQEKSVCYTKPTSDTFLHARLYVKEGE